MDDATTKFIDYLTTNHSGIDEESLLLSPILDGSIYTTGSTSKRLRSSARLKRRQTLLTSEKKRESSASSIPEHDVLHYQDQKPVFSPQASASSGEKGMFYGALLDTSACPSLGLGSVGTSNDSKSYLSNGSEGDLSLNANVNDSVRISGEHVSSSFHEHESNDETGLSFDSEVSRSHDSSHSLQFPAAAKDDDRSDDGSHGDEQREFSSAINVEKAIVVDDQSPRIQLEPRPQAIFSPPSESNTKARSPPLADNQRQSSARVTQSPKCEVDQSSEPDAVTPRKKVSLTSTMEAARRSLTPSKSITKIRNGLTPRLKALRSKMLRESVGNYTDADIELSSASDIEPTTPHETIRSAGLSLNPALKSIRSKLYQESLGDGEIIGVANQLPSSTSTNYRSPGESEGMEERVEAKTPTDSKESDRLSLTPALKAFRMKLMNSTLSPMNDTPLSQESASASRMDRRDLLSPALRPSMSTVATSGSSRRTRRVVFEDEDSYLGQPNDLSSAKKNLNAQSSVLAERLRGAAHKRMISITRSRDSLAAKESLHFGKHDDESETDDEAARIIMDRQVALHKVVEEKEVRRGVENSQEKVKPSAPSIAGCEDRIGVPKITRRPTTVPISPKLGSRRDDLSLSSSAKGMPKLVKSNNTEKPKSLGASDEGKREQRGLPTVKRRPLTIPKSPCLGARRNLPESKASSDNKMKHSKQIDLDKSRKSPSTASPSFRSDSPVGLGFLTPASLNSNHDGEENVPPTVTSPFTLHSSIRAKERALFEASRSINEKLRNEEIKKERDRILSEKYRELGRLKEKLR